MEQKHKGAASELMALIWLLKEGYEVYRNVSAHGIADMIAIKNNEILKIDVKTAKFSASGKIACNGLTKEQKENDIVILAISLENNEVLGFIDKNYIPDQFICKVCGKKEHGNGVRSYCSIECRTVGEKEYRATYMKSYRKNGG